MDQLLTAADAARVLQLTPASIRLMIRLGQLPVACVTAGGIRLLRRADVEALAAQRAKRQASSTPTA